MPIRAEEEGVSEGASSALLQKFDSGFGHEHLRAQVTWRFSIRHGSRSKFGGAGIALERVSKPLLCSIFHRLTS
jgi:hypothetical protein